ncbi:Smr/MutS family protein [Brumimicrobium oceani]|uniref:DNA mismatch repair protein MutS n=1 Tax=Brumimicrobium oceani TaxID=2100725 RepID=A0A2U2XH53_9FLAO|nr:Smr/MutS family protein [Brumimicrobium oceani]PWH87124.1 DNA mismatch repair protein MutS [Brumimicrobium oceani]
MRFKIGEKVGFLREVGGGIVQSYKNDQIVIVEDETGFEREFMEEDLNSIIGDQSNILSSNFDINDVIEETVSYSDDLGDITKNKDFWEIDLHTHVLMESERGLSNGQLLSHQLLEFKRFFRKAREKSIRKLVVIHGVGEGVLKSEIRQFLEGKEGIDFYDADFRKYGKGATTVELFYR